ncbi:MAG TPA: hypothetical protein VMT03_17740 [Polyangia bacterium]|nr:hypothetical protein [Polyangia bacterium]
MKPPSPDELRDLGAAFARKLGAGAPIVLRDDEEVVGSVPVGPATAMLLTYQAHRSGAGHRDQVVLRVVARGADGERLALSGRIVVPAASLGALAGVIADAMERAGSRIRPNGRRDAIGINHANPVRAADQGAQQRHDDDEPTAA